MSNLAKSTLCSFFFCNKQMTLKIVRLFAYAVLFVSSLAFVQGEPAEWQTPTNLSSSGAATRPISFIDSSGTIHVLWIDNGINSYMYRTGTPGSWSAPRPIEPPFGSRQFTTGLDEQDSTPLYSPTIQVDSNGNIHAVWTDLEGDLFYSWVEVSQFDSLASWLTPQQLGSSTIEFTFEAEGGGRLHLSYIHTDASDSLQPGVYYRRLASVENFWSPPQLLYASPYFRQLTAAQANTYLAISPSGFSPSVFLTWDIPSLEKIYYARSIDSGISWEDPVVVDERQPDDGPNTIGPNSVWVAVNSRETLLFWQAGHGLNTCKQYYQVSDDGGATWESPEVLLDEISGCPTMSQYIGSAGGVYLYFFLYENQPYLIAWKDGVWSLPQSQQELSGFISPETFRRINLGCHQFNIVGQNQLLSLGCGVGQGEQTEDIWQLIRPAGDLDMWFPPAPIWAEPEVLFSEVANLIPPRVVADNQGRIHVVWSQPGENAGTMSEIYYRFLDDDRWSQSVPILSAQEGEISLIDLTITAEDRLILLWVTSSGNLFFSQSSSDQAILRSEWSPPVVLPSPGAQISGVDVAVSEDGSIYIVCSVPINDPRGVYLLQSSDDGKSWSNPEMAIDGADLDWDIVGSPQLELSGEGIIHLLVSEEMLLANSVRFVSKALYYSRSDSFDGDFSQPELVTESPAGWAKIIDDNRQITHRLWQESNVSAIEISHQFSLDGGNTWIEPIRLTNQQGPIDVAVDSVGRLHAIQMTEDELSHRVWSGNIWQLDDDVISDQTEMTVSGEPQGISVVIDSNQRLQALIATREFRDNPPEMLFNAFVTWRTLTPPSSDSLSLPTPVPEPTPTQLVQPPGTSDDPAETTDDIAEVSRTPLDEQEQRDGLFSQFTSIINTDNVAIRLAVSLVPVAIFLVVILAVGLWIVRRIR